MEINKKLSRRERVYLQLAEMTQQITMNRIDHFDFKEYDATGIGKCLNITMNNTCMELNSLVKDGLVVKILGRPDFFCQGRVGAGYRCQTPPVYLGKLRAV